MNESAIVLNNTNIIKVFNLPRKYKKLINNPDIKILEECTKEEIENKYLYWKNQYKAKDVEEESQKLYKFINKKTGTILLSIYSSIDSIKKRGIGNTSWLDDYEQE